MSFPAPAALLILAGLSVGCIGPNAFFVAPTKVEVKVRSCAFVSDRQGSLGIDLRVADPYPIEAMVETVQWDLSLDERWFGSGVQKIGRRLKPDLPEEIFLPIELTFGQVRVTPTKASVGLRLWGTLRVVLPLDSIDLPFEAGPPIECAGNPRLAPSDEEDG